MEHTVHQLDAVVRPWRAATLLAGAFAALELVVVVVLAIALLSSGDEGSGSSAGPEAAKKPVVPQVLTRSRTRVLVLNGNGQDGAAGAAAEQISSLSYPIAAVGNANRSDYGRTTVLYRPGRRTEARRLARDLGVRLIGPLDGMGAGKLGRAHLAVIVGD